MPAEILSTFEGKEIMTQESANATHEGVTTLAEDNEDDLHAYDGEGLGIDEEEDDIEHANTTIPSMQAANSNNIQSALTPDWLKKLFKEKCAFIQKQTKKPGQSDLYSIHQTFWLPKHTSFFNLQAANPSQLSPNLAFEPSFFFWDPHSILGELR